MSEKLYVIRMSDKETRYITEGHDEWASTSDVSRATRFTAATIPANIGEKYLWKRGSDDPGRWVYPDPKCVLVVEELIVKKADNRGEG